MRALLWLLPPALLWALLPAMPPPAMGQALSGAFDDFKVGPDEPINIQSDTLEVRQREKKAIFKGGVVVVRGDIRITAPQLTVTYEEADKKKPGSRTQITQLETRQTVQITSKTQTARGDWAVMDVLKRQITMGGNVVLRQEKTVIEGSRLEVDLNTGLSKLFGGAKGAKGGRVRGVFVPKRKEKKKK